MSRARKGIGCLVLVLLVLVSSTAAFGGAPVAPECWSQWLSTSPPTGVTWRNTAFGDAIDWLRNRDATGSPCTMNLVVDWQALEEAGIDRDTEFELQVSDVPLAVIVGLMLEQVGGDTQLGYEANGNVLRISTADRLASRLVVRTYDLTPVTTSVPDFTNGPQVDMTLSERTVSARNGGAGGPGMSLTSNGEAVGPNRAERMTELMETIQSTVDPDHWAANGGEGSMGLAGTMLVVRQSPDVQEKIAILLARLSKN